MKPLILCLLVLTQLTALAKPAEVYLLSGQSNMLGSGKVNELKEADRQPIDNVFIWDKTAFIPLAPNQLNAINTRGQFGPELGFAQRLRMQKPDQSIYLIKYAASGQPLHFGWDRNTWKGLNRESGRWNFYPGDGKDRLNRGKHYGVLIQTITDALHALETEGRKFRIRGFLWMQGEQDSKHEVSADTYAQNLKLLKSQLENDINKKRPIPMVFGQVLPHTPPAKRFTHRELIRQRQTEADYKSGHAHAIRGAAMIPTEGLPLCSDTVHYNTKGQLQLGARFAEKLFKNRPKSQHRK